MTHGFFSLIRGESAVLPWLLPGAAVSLAVSLAFGGRVARALGTRRAVGSLLLLTFGIIVSATLTPLGGAFAPEAGVAGSCDFSRIGLPPLEAFRELNDTSLNVMLFIPFGFAIALVPQSRRAFAVLLAAIAFPFLIEATQAIVTPLARGCESADVIDNLLGLALGVAAGVAARAVVSAAGRSLDPLPDPQ
jgi:VanZ family protein